MKVLMMVPENQVIDRRVLQQAHTLGSAGYEVTLLAGFQCEAETHYRQDNVDIHRYAYGSRQTQFRRLQQSVAERGGVKQRIYQLLAKIARQVGMLSPYDQFILATCRQFPADVIHVHDLLLLKYGAILAHEWQVPLVYDAHEIYTRQEILGREILDQFKREEKRYLKQANLFLTVNDGLADYYEQTYRRRPLVLLNAIDPPPATYRVGAAQRLRQKAGLPDNSRVVLFQGWISSERNLSALVRSTEYFSEGAYLVIIGYGVYENDLRAEVKGQPWEKRVRFLGKVEFDEVMHLTAGADLGIIPYLPVDLNHRLCSPNKFFEFVQSETPMLTHDLPFFHQMAERYGVPALADLSTANGIATAINELLNNPEKLMTMRAGCRKAAAIINWENEGNKLLKAYQRFVAQSSTTS
jgi:glycosyltransferase involved in cell wall biosynthesis